jgi:structural maintenance of chromosome 1
VKNAEKLSEQVQKDVEKKEEKVRSLTRDLESVRKAADAVQGEITPNLNLGLTDFDIEAQRRASMNNISLSEESLEEYRRLFVVVHRFCILTNAEQI